MNLKFTQEGGLARCTALPAPVCVMCDGEGNASRQVDDGFGGVHWVGGRCRCRMPVDRAKLFNEAGVPARFALASFATWRSDVGSQAAYAGVQAWLKAYASGDERRGLVLCGEPGRGKTHLLISAGRSLILDHGILVRFVEFAHLLSELKASMGSDVSPETLLRPYVDCDVLILDELGGG